MTEPPRILSLFGGVVLFGQERGNIEALLALKEEGCEVLCLIRDEEWIERIPEALDSHGLEWRKVSFIYAWNRVPAPADVAGTVMRLWRGNLAFLRAVRQFRPTHIHAFNQLNVLSFLPGLCLVRLPLVYRAGDQPTVHRLLWRLTWSAVRLRTTHFVSISRFVRDSLIAHGVRPDRISVILSRPPTRQLSESRTRPQLPEGRIWFIFVGQIVPQKGVDVFIEAMKLLVPSHPPVGALVLGRVSDWSGDAWARELQEKVNADPLLAQRVIFTGEVEDIHSYLSCAAVHVAPSTFPEPLGNVVLEAKQAGIPSVVFPMGGLPEMIEHDVDGQVCSEPTAASLAGSLSRYLDDPGLAARQGDAARRSLARLGNDSFAAEWIKVLRMGAAR